MNTLIESHIVEHNNNTLISMDGKNTWYNVRTRFIAFRGMGGNPVYDMHVKKDGKEYVYNIETKIGGLEEGRNKSLYLLFLDAILVKGDTTTSPNSEDIEHLFTEFTNR